MLGSSVCATISWCCGSTSEPEGVAVSASTHRVGRSRSKIYGAGCPVCEEAEAMVRRIVRNNHDTETPGVHQAHVAYEPERPRFGNVPSVVAHVPLLRRCDRPDRSAISKHPARSIASGPRNCGRANLLTYTQPLDPYTGFCHLFLDPLMCFARQASELRCGPAFGCGTPNERCDEITIAARVRPDVQFVAFRRTSPTR